MQFRIDVSVKQWTLLNLRIFRSFVVGYSELFREFKKKKKKNTQKQTLSIEAAVTRLKIWLDREVEGSGRLSVTLLWLMPWFWSCVTCCCTGCEQTQDAEENSEEGNTFTKKNQLHRKETHRWSHVKISFDSESLRVEQDPQPPSTGIGAVVSGSTVPPSIKIIGKEVSCTQQKQPKTTKTTNTSNTTKQNKKKKPILRLGVVIQLTLPHFFVLI